MFYYAFVNLTRGEKIASGLGSEQRSHFEIFLIVAKIISGFTLLLIVAMISIEGFGGMSPRKILDCIRDRPADVF